MVIDNYRLFLVNFTIVIFISFCVDCEKRIRKKRYLTFPEGASFTGAICMTAPVITPAARFSEFFAFGMVYNLPNDTSLFKPILKKKNVAKARHRRDLYQKLETIITSIGHDGRECILKILCESGQKLKKKRNNVLEEILWTIFRLPMDALLLEEESEDHWHYHMAHKKGLELDDKDCAEIYSQCKPSFMDMLINFVNN